VGSNRIFIQSMCATLIAVTGSLAPLSSVLVTKVFDQTFTTSNSQTSFQTTAYTLHPARSRAFAVFNTTGQSATINTTYSVPELNGGFGDPNARTANPGQTSWWNASQFPYLNDPHNGTLTINISFTTAPTSGRLAISIYEQP
jgi:hypothetical protein